MPYTINRTNGLKITVVQDGTINTSALDITLIGKNYTGYGETFNENFVKLLENFSNTTPPKKPLSGQLFFNSSTKSLKVYDGTKFKSIGVVESSDTKPTGMNAGDLWYKTSEKRLYAYSGVGSDWILVGPISTKASVSGAIEATITATNLVSQTILKQIVAGQNTFISSADRFDVSPTDDAYSVFPRIKQGITFPSADANGISYSPNVFGHILWGTSATALGLVKNNGDYVSADDYLRRSELASITGSITVNNDDGILIGSQDVLKLHITDSNVANASVINGSILKINARYNGNQYYNIISLTTGTNNDPKVLPNPAATVYIGTSSNPFSYAYVNTVTSNAIYDNGARVLTTSTIAGTANQINVTAGIGAITLSLPQNIHASASPRFNGMTLSSLTAGSSPSIINGAWQLAAGATFQATYADLAERYAADAEYTPGTVLIIGGIAEVTTTDRHGNTAVAGIVSTNPAYTLNETAGDNSTHPYVALKGRVPCKVTGSISKGDLLVTSYKTGYAERAHANDNPNAILGRALADFDGDDGVIEVMIA
jgi:hypothetical protein